MLSTNISPATPVRVAANLRPKYARTSIIDRPIPVAPAAQELSALHGIAFLAALAMIFVRFGVIPEMLVAVTGLNTYLLYIVGPPAILGCLVTGGFVRAFRSRQVWCWTGFFVWMVLATPFSSWRGASAGIDLGYLRTDLVCLYVVAGLVVTWDEVVKTLNVLAAAAFVTLLVTRLAARPDKTGRLSLDLGFDGVISNANDLAGHLVLLLPFILFLIMKPRRNNVLRILMFGCIFYGLWIILGTASRGAMIGLFAMALFLFYRASGMQRVVVMVTVPVLAVALLAILPSMNIARLATLFSGGSVANTQDEAGESMATRQRLLEKSIKYTLQHPLFGVGPSQFSNFEGLTSKALGEASNWNETHNTYTEISSECGIPALILAMTAMIGTFVLVNKSYKAARKVGDKEVMRVCLCFLASWTGYLVTITFLACAYRFTLPAMIGLGVAIHAAAQRRLADAARDFTGRAA